MRHAISIDVEDYFHVAAFQDIVGSDDWANIPSRVQANTDKVLEIMADAGVIGTFFVLGWAAERYPSLVKSIVAAGHEVACHGYSHRQIYHQSREEFREETRRAKAILEDQSGSPVTGYRAATFSVTKKTLWALDELVEAGFDYDSSIFPIRHDNYGLAEAPVEPYLATGPEGGQLAEFPISVLQLGGMKLPIAGGGYFRLFPYAVTRWGLNRIAASGRPTVFYLHPWEVDPEQPRFENARRFSKFRHYNNLDRCESRFRRLLKDFEFTTVHNVLVDQGLLPC
jgi:polysaccharide deacetylase family protein (PEP-CTERM system associated)